MKMEDMITRNVRTQKDTNNSRTLLKTLVSKTVGKHWWMMTSFDIIINRIYTKPHSNHLPACWWGQTRIILITKGKTPVWQVTKRINHQVQINCTSQHSVILNPESTRELWSYKKRGTHSKNMVRKNHTEAWQVYLISVIIKRTLNTP